MFRVPNHPQQPGHYEWIPAELVRTNDLVTLSAIEALLAQAHIPYLVTDRNVSVLAGSIDAFPRRVIVGDCVLPMRAGCYWRRDMAASLRQRNDTILRAYGDTLSAELVYACET